jgi:hypothetical protein
MKKSIRSNGLSMSHNESDYENYENKDDSFNDKSISSYSNKNGTISTSKKQKMTIKLSPKSITETPLRSSRSRGNINSNQNHTNNNNNDKTNNSSSPQSIIYVSDSDITNQSEDISFKSNNNVFIC